MKVITSFSYKGGAGRTVASANIAAALASCKGPRGAIETPLNYKVALLDLDVFSAGTHRALEIDTEKIELFKCVQDYLLLDIKVEDYVRSGGIRFDSPSKIMSQFRKRGADGYCRDDFTLFPAKQEDKNFIVQKYYENQLIALIVQLESQGFDYLILDGESGIRSMADIALRLADVIIMFFRLTWQHIEGTLKALQSLTKEPHVGVYLIPTCVPLVGAHDGVYDAKAPGLDRLRDATRDVPATSRLNKYAADHSLEKQYGYFWANQICVHDSLILKGGECVLVYDDKAPNDRAAQDYYQIAAKLSEFHPPQ